MNYRHIFHAGNRCDVVKHAVLTRIVGHLRAKDKGFSVIDTHAGCGLYDLDDPRAQKTGEADAGVKALLDAPPVAELADYYSVLRKMNPLWNGQSAQGLRVYPGSPLFAFHLLRDQDRLSVCELHPEDAGALRLNCPADSRLHIHNRDGYEALAGFLPPPEKRGLVLIDPPYERADEFDTLARYVQSAHQRWPTGIYALWYPVKDRPAIWRFHEKLTQAGIGKILRAEFIYAPETRGDTLNGSGMLLINPPWKLEEDLRALFPALHAAMKTPHNGDDIGWLAA